MKKRFALLFCVYAVLASAVSAQVCQTVGNVIDNVSVNDAGQAVITWRPPARLPANATGYIIYNYLGGTQCTEEIARVNLTASSFIHPVPVTAPRAYSMAVNTDVEPEPITQEHAFCYLQAAYDSCKYIVDLQWTPYVGWNEVTYRIYGGIQGTSPALLAENVRENRYVLENVPDNVLFYVYVVAANNAGSQSRSNRPAVHTKTAQRPQYLTVDSVEHARNMTKVMFSVDPQAQLPTYRLMRSRTKDGGFSPLFTFTDKTIHTHTDRLVTGGYYYRLEAENHCHHTVAGGAAVNSLLIEGILSGDRWQLRWSPLMGNNPQYTLTRFLPLPAVALYAGQSTSWEDAADPAATSLEYCYRLTAGRGDGAKSTAEQCFSWLPGVVMPDAVNPFSTVANPHTGRQRNQFGPVISAHPSTYSYLLEIYSHNGERIAVVEKQAHDAPEEKSWTGKRHNSQTVPENTYLYRLHVTFNNGQTTTRTGTVAVVYD